MIPRLVPEIEGGYPERDGGGEEEEEGQGWGNSSKLMRGESHPGTILIISSTKIHFSEVLS